MTHILQLISPNKFFTSKSLFVISILLLLFSCKKVDRTYQPSHLKKLDKKELIFRLSNDFYLDKNSVFKDSIGNIIPDALLKSLDPFRFFAEPFVDENGKIIELVVRQATEEDKKVLEEIRRNKKEKKKIDNIDKNIISINCDSISPILVNVYSRDQNNRGNGVKIDKNIDYENQKIVISIIEECGYPSVKTVGEKGISAMFYTIQHSNVFLMERYFPYFKKSYENRELSFSSIALMEDRILMLRNKKQKYGSQVKKDKKTNEWYLYPVEDIKNVNKLRAEKGLSSLEEYLKKWNIEIDTLN